ncbi:MAG: aminoacyl-tRNA hydrolase [bacterium]|nr:aminoacyl-tRNA hydrolase [bacterium]
MSTILIAGLGNPEAKHANNRHNLGFMVLDALVKAWQLPPFAENRSLGGLLTAKAQEPKAWLLKPMTYMNESGEAIRDVSRFYSIRPDNIWVVHDDLDIPFGTLKIQYDISAGGHNGIRSIIRDLQSQKFWRFRFGISRPHPTDANADGRVDSREWAIAKYDSAEFVLSDFDQMQAAQLPTLIQRTIDALAIALAQSPEKAANQFNGTPAIENTPAAAKGAGM